jgi:hypothetical protein
LDNLFSTTQKKVTHPMPVITIPFDFDPHGDGESTVPIYLNDTDENGEKIFFGWIEAVVPIQDKLKALSRRILGDVWGVSELTDITIQQSNICGGDTGRTSGLTPAIAFTGPRDERPTGWKIRPPMGTSRSTFPWTGSKDSGGMPCSAIRRIPKTVTAPLWIFSCSKGN